MRSARLPLVPLSALIVALAGTVHAEERQHSNAQAPLALATGVAIMGSSLAVGGWLMARPGTLRQQHAGLTLLHTGFVAAPVLAHGVVGEWKRGVLFGIAPALAAAGMAALLIKSPTAPVISRDGDHRLFPIPITLGLIGATTGVVDAALVDTRTVSISAAADVRLGTAQVYVGGIF